MMCKKRIYCIGDCMPLVYLFLATLQACSTSKEYEQNFASQQVTYYQINANNHTSIPRCHQYRPHITNVLSKSTAVGGSSERIGATTSFSSCLCPSSS